MFQKKTRKEPSTAREKDREEKRSKEKDTKENDKTMSSMRLDCLPDQWKVHTSTLLP